MSLVIVNDRDAAFVQTSGQWSREPGSKEEYQVSSTSLNPGNVMVYTWSGKDINVYGTIAYDGGGNVTFALDRGNPIKYTSQKTDTTLYHQQFWSSGAIEDGPHTLTITQDAGDYRRTQFFDYVTYLAGPSTKYDVNSLTFFDDTTLNLPPTFIPFKMAKSFQNSVSSAASGAVFEFKFTGVGVTVMGVLTGSPTPYKAAFTLDGQPSAVIYNGGANTDPQYNQQLYDAGNLEAGKEHTLQFTAQSAGLAIDYILVKPGDGSKSSSVSSARASPTGTGTSNDSHSNDSSDKSTPIGPIVGGVVGGIAAIAIIAALLWFFLIKKKQKYSSAEKGTPFETEPFTPPARNGAHPPYGTDDTSSYYTGGVYSPGRSEYSSDARGPSMTTAPYTDNTGGATGADSRVRSPGATSSSGASAAYMAAPLVDRKGGRPLRVISHTVQPSTSTIAGPTSTSRPMDDNDAPPAYGH